MRLGVWASVVLSVVVGATWLWAGSVLQPLADYDDVEADRVNEFCRVFLIGLLPFNLYVALSNFLGSTGIVRPALYVNLASVVFNLAFNLVLVSGPARLGFAGSALSTSLTRLVVFLALLAWTLHDARVQADGPVAKAWPRSWLAWPRPEHAKEFTAQALPVAISSLLEEAQVQVVALMAARLGDAPMATHNAVLNVIFVLSSFMWAAAGATQVRMSVHIGAGDMRRAKLVLRIGLGMALVVGLSVSCMFMAARGDLALLFTKDEEIRHLTGEISTIVGLGYFLLAAFYISMSVLSAQARPGAMALAFFTGAWGVGVPMAVVLAFHVEKTKGLVGLWLGLTMGYGVVTIISAVAVWSSDWDKVLADAKQRSSHAPSSHLNAEGSPREEEPSTSFVVAVA